MADLKSQTADSKRTGRRNFFRVAGAGAAGTALLVAGCDSGDPGVDPPPEADVTLDFSNDFGPLNYAYALEQLEAAFYAEVATAIDSNDLFVDDPTAAGYFLDLAAHEAIHRDFLNAAISDNGGTPIPDLEVDFSDVDFGDDNGVLAIAQVLEDTGVSAYNGAGQYIEDNDFLTIAGKIVSVEARHAAAVRAFIGGSTNFADLSDIDRGANTQFALDAALSPSDVLTAVTDPDTGFVTTTIAITGLPDA